MGIIGTLAMVILAPIAAMLVQMAISRTREYSADSMGAQICGQPMWLASALAKIQPTRRTRSRTSTPNANRGWRTCSSSTRCRASGWTTCSRPIRRPRTGSRRWTKLAREMGQGSGGFGSGGFGSEPGRAELARQPLRRAHAARCRPPAPWSGGPGRRSAVASARDPWGAEALIQNRCANSIPPLKSAWPLSAGLPAIGWRGTPADRGSGAADAGDFFDDGAASVAEQTRLSLFLMRRGLRRATGRVEQSAADAVAHDPAQDRPAAAVAAGSAHRGRHPRERNLFRPLRLCRQGGDLRRPLAVRIESAVRGMGGRAVRFRLAAPSARRRFRHHPRQCARTGRRMDLASGRLAFARLAHRRAGAAGDFLDQSGAADPAGRRRAVLSPLHAQPEQAGALPAPQCLRSARRRACICRSRSR